MERVKKILKYVGVGFAGFIILSILLVACVGTDTEDAEPNASQVEEQQVEEKEVDPEMAEASGTYKFSFFLIDGDVITADMADDYFGEPYSEIGYTLCEDGTGTATLISDGRLKTIDVIWARSGDVLLINGVVNEYDADREAIAWEDDGTTMVFEKNPTI